MAALPDFGQYEMQYGLPPGYLRGVAKIESGLNPSARNPKSTAKGLFQFIDGTAKQYGLANPMDPVASTDAAARLARDNAKRLAAVLKRAPTKGELYVAHQQGAGGASKLFRQPDMLAAALVGHDAVRLNGGNPATTTAGEFAQKWAGKLDGVQKLAPRATPEQVEIPEPLQTPEIPEMTAAAQQAPEVKPLPFANDSKDYDQSLQGIMSVEATSPWMALAQALSAGYVGNEKAKNESAIKERDSVAAQNFAQMVPEGPNKSLIVAMAQANPELRDKIMATMAGSALQDPQERELRQVQLEKARAETDKLKNPPQRDNLSLNPIYMTDEAGNTVIGQLGADGVMRKTVLPEGAKVSTGVDKIDMGTSFALVDKRSGQVVGTMPKDVAGEAAAKEIGKAQGEAKAGLGSTLTGVDQSLKLAAEIAQDPALDSNTGRLGQFNPYISQSGTDWAAKVEQLSNQAFLAAAKDLSGMGALSNNEGIKLSAAKARLSTAQSPQAFRAALGEYAELLEQLKQNAIRKAQGGGQPAPASTTPAAPRRIKVDAQGNIIQ